MIILLSECFEHKALLFHSEFDNVYNVITITGSWS